MEAIAWVLGLGIAAFLLFRFPRPFLLTAAVMLGLGAAVGGYFWWQWNAAQREQALVELSAAADDRCTPDYPIFIGTVNKATRAVEKVYFNIRAFRPGYSNDVYSDTYKSSDRIVGPGEGWGTCWSLTAQGKTLDIKSLEWRAELLSATFASK